MATAPEGSFGEQLRRLRERAGLTQEEVAERAGLTPDAIGMLERGVRRQPHPGTVRALADALGLPGGERAALLAAVPRRGTARRPRPPAAPPRPPCRCRPRRSSGASGSWRSSGSSSARARPGS
jgi:transcriptional regulator with XRE-family HTH domain